MSEPLPVRGAQLDLLTTSARSQERRGSFTDNMKLPVHRWFRYSAGFSAEWCEHVIQRHPEARVVLDPFAGSATSLIAAQNSGLRAHGFEAHEFVARVAQAKLAWTTEPAAFIEEARAFGVAASAAPPNGATQPDLMLKCFSAEALHELSQLRQTYKSYAFTRPEHAQLIWLAITSLLRECSYVGTAQWQYVLPNKRKAQVKRPLDAFGTRTRDMFSDMLALRGHATGRAEIELWDARQRSLMIGSKEVDLVITSPPYPNNYDYADATRLEMTFWGELASWSELHSKVRRNLVVSCSQHSAAEKMRLEEMLCDPLLGPIRDELTDVCHALEEQRGLKAGKKTYHTMIAGYFRDLAAVWVTLRHHTRSGATCYFVVGDSAPYGVYAPVDKWLGELALAAGFESWTFEKFRDRNTKWKNRKHQVPLKEGLLTVHG